MTLNSETSTSASPRTTAAGLESWMSAGYADVEPIVAAAPASEDRLPETPAEAPADPGPVNAAEALALGTIATACKFVGTDGAELVIDPEHEAYYFESTSLKPLAVLLQQPVSARAPVYSEAIKAIRSSGTPQPLARLRWYAGLIATPGILGRELNRTGRYKLSRWPETEREFPKHFRIAKEMLRDAATVDEIVAASGMPYEEVVDYVNASSAGGWLEGNATREPPRENSQLSRRERLIARLNKPLFVREHS